MKNKKLLNKTIALMLVLITVMSAAVSSGCSSNTETEESQNEHGTSGEDNEDSEESGDLLTLNDTYDTVRKGARLIMSYDAQSKTFVGTVENTTNITMQQVRVEVHLSNGTELGPTTPTDLAPDEKMDVTLPATTQVFTGWTPHAEVGPGIGD